MQFVALDDADADAVAKHEVDEHLAIDKHHLGGGAARDKLTSARGEGAGGDENALGDSLAGE